MSTLERASFGGEQPASEPRMAAIACGPDGCQPVLHEVAMALLAAANEAKARRAIAMPDDKTAIRALTDAHSRLTELGWRQATYAPRGRALELIECGSSGIHRGERDEIGFWIHDGETWPSHPVLYRIASDSPAPSLEKAAVERPDGAR